MGVDTEVMAAAAAATPRCSFFDKAIVSAKVFSSRYETKN